MYKQELTRYLAKKNRRPQRHYQEALTEILDGIKEKLADGKDVQLKGFGTFSTRMHKAGRGRNFKTKQTMQYKPVRMVVFRVGSLLKQAVRRKKGLFKQ